MYCGLCGEVVVQSLNLHNFLKPKNRICHRCTGELERVTGGCRNCGKKDVQGLCDDCQFWRRHGLNIPHASIYYYNDFSRMLVQRIKYNGDLRILKTFQPEICRFVKKKYRNRRMIVVPVPLHEKKYLMRGFNQSKIIAESLPFPLLDIVKKTRNITQSQRNKRERLMAIGDFDIKEYVDLRKNHVLIIDDIYTTGSTIHQVARCLEACGANKISSFSLFRSM